MHDISYFTSLSLSLFLFKTVTLTHITSIKRHVWRPFITLLIHCNFEPHWTICHYTLHESWQETCKNFLMQIPLGRKGVRDLLWVFCMLGSLDPQSEVAVSTIFVFWLGCDFSQNISALHSMFGARSNLGEKWSEVQVFTHTFYYLCYVWEYNKTQYHLFIMQDDSDL